MVQGLRVWGLNFRLRVEALNHESKLYKPSSALPSLTSVLGGEESHRKHEENLKTKQEEKAKWFYINFVRTFYTKIIRIAVVIIIVL